MQNKICKFIFSILIIVFMFNILTITVNAEDNLNLNVYDIANLLSDEEENKLQKLSEEYKQFNVDMVFLTINDANGKTTKTYTEDFYEKQNFGENGIVVAIDMDNKEVYINTIGICINIFSDTLLDNILDNTYQYATNEQYYNFFQNTETKLYIYVEEYIEENTTVSPLLPTKGAIIFSVIATFIIITVLIIKHYSANKRPKAQIYLKQNFRIINRRETFIGDRREVHHNYYAQPKQNTTNRIGGSSHKSSSGRTHGGRGRKF